MYNPYDWYWLADDKRVFASKRQAIVDDTDTEYVAWAESVVATEWPRDLAGDQTDAALQAVLTPYVLFVDLGYYTTYMRWVTLQAGITVNGKPFMTDALSLSALNSAYIYTQGNVNASFQWKLADGSFVTLTKQQTDLLHDVANVFAQNCYKCESTTLAAIDAGTITTRAQIDAAFAAIPKDFTGAMAFETSWQPKMRTKR